MARPGYKHFPVCAPFRTPPILDGFRLRGTPRPLQKTPSSGANIITMLNSDAVIQLDYRDDDVSEDQCYYNWDTFVWTAHQEAEWYHIKFVAKRKRAVYFCPCDYEPEVFLIAQEFTDFRLPRPTGISVFGADFPADFAFYPITASVDGVDKTVVGNLTPGADEIGVLGQLVKVGTALSAGNELRILYVPAYRVVVEVPPEGLQDYNHLAISVTIREARRSA